MGGDILMLSQLVLHEGLERHVYVDTLENETLGVGFNVSARSLEEFGHLCGRHIQWTEGDYVTPIISEAEAIYVLEKDVDRVTAAVRVRLPVFDTLDDVRQRVVIDLAFNLGFRALSFKDCIADINKRDWSGASRELYKSKWAYQVGDGPGGKFDRADRLAGMLLTGKPATDIPLIA